MADPAPDHTALPELSQDPWDADQLPLHEPVDEIIAWAESAMAPEEE